ncbi:Molybdopterin biosynthesis protein MoeA [Candidatus Rhodobacter oscarellae]|uniref:Molybdopterin molybdenumtransferase n=1 Tax=Candidatus Rhodobacter oscarellae TaxID=1675527 RepID=A0A0J9GT57_9RHOB|nr:molybdopterin molybdotransferase MoeA [Candidatus Rhodobacter lobularis]KMW56668.1 Molybdopterin biosynthesis protein MoeA [Candidatus Rhodobacter lobularis]
MISVDEALTALFALVEPLDAEIVPLAQANGRVLARPVAARRDQPPFAASAMDGYAVIDGSGPFTVIGESAAGHGFGGAVGLGEAVRIFTGAPVPGGANRVIIQEDVTRDGDTITLRENMDTAPYIRPAGGDFAAGAEIAPPRLLRPSDLAMLAAMNVSEVPVTRRPTVAIIATGDELVMPGEDPGPDQIIASNAVGLAAMVAETGGLPRVLPIARDNAPSLRTAFEIAQGADLIVTIGGASVGDHDLVAPVAEALGMERAFYKIAMRPGKPLMAGRIGQSAMIGLPGNPVSSLVCGTIFVLPMLRAMLGLGEHPAPRQRAELAVDIGPNGPREHYMRARLTHEGIAPFERQDSSLLSVLGDANALLIRPVKDGTRRSGDAVEYVPI